MASKEQLIKDCLAACKAHDRIGPDNAWRTNDNTFLRGWLFEKWVGTKPRIAGKIKTDRAVPITFLLYVDPKQEFYELEEHVKNAMAIRVGSVAHLEAALGAIR